MKYRPRKKRGRPRQGRVPLTATERQARWRGLHPETNRARSREGMERLRTSEGNAILRSYRLRNQSFAASQSRNLDKQYSDTRPRFQSAEVEAEYDYRKATGHGSHYKPRKTSSYDYAMELLKE